ncbi:MAG: hypothetical protein ACR2QW_12745 [bacterium]
MSHPVIHPLNSEYDHWHEVTGLRYQQFLQSITALELDDAERHLQLFSKLLRSSIDFSDERLKELLEKTDQSFEMVKADHLILIRTMTLVENALVELQKIESISPTTLRAELVSRLDLLVRLSNILNKHQLRQIELLFPLFEAKISTAEANTLAVKLTEAMQQAQPN